MSADSYNQAAKMEQQPHLEHQMTAGGHIAETSQPQLPIYHRKLANPTPLGLLSFATGIFFISCVGVGARGITINNMLIAIPGLSPSPPKPPPKKLDSRKSNTKTEADPKTEKKFGATVFSSYGAFNISYSMIYLPGSGIVAAYTDSATGQLSPEFDQALGLYYTAWCIVTFLFAVGACRASWVVVLILCFFDLECLLLAAGLMSGNAGVLKAGNGVGFVVAVLC
ncbi:hypothetical protein MMC08_008606, partial [Hypocenomyce scalaris]|nr:hypothetical protein [Hypocenomyce scalaris]